MGGRRGARDRYGESREDGCVEKQRTEKVLEKAERAKEGKKKQTERRKKVIESRDTAKSGSRSRR